MESIISFLGSAKLARKQVHKNLTLFPLLGSNGSEPDYLTLEQALASHQVRIFEVNEGGSVPELRLKNSGVKSVLIVEGEELVGAKQNRIVNASFLIAGKAEVVIPVSCVEQGRWDYRSDEFASGQKVMHASLRRDNVRDVGESLSRGGGHHSDQGRIWQNIREKSARMGVASDTSAAADVFEHYKDNLSAYLEHFRLIECQIGAVFALNGQVLGLECFGCHETFGRYFGKLVKSYALDAIDSPSNNGGSESVPPAKARSFVDAIRGSTSEQYPSISLGTTVVLASRTVSGAALVESDTVLHLSVFKKEKGEHPNTVGLQRYSQRRRYRI